MRHDEATGNDWYSDYDHITGAVGTVAVPYCRHLRINLASACSSYVYLSIGVEDPNDITGATAFDVTGDGKAEVIVYGVLRAKASKNMGGKTITRQVMFIYGVRESGIRRLFAAETGRSLDDNAIVGRVRFLPGKKGRVIELGPGHAVGWQQDTYPFPPDRFQ